MNVSNTLASLAVSDLATAGAWYERLLGPGSSPMPEVIEWQFRDGGGLQVYAGPDRSGNGSCTIIVDDIDDLADHLRSLGIADARTGAQRARRHVDDQGSRWQLHRLRCSTIRRPRPLKSPPAARPDRVSGPRTGRWKTPCMSSLTSSITWSIHVDDRGTSCTSTRRCLTSPTGRCVASALAVGGPASTAATPAETGSS